MPRIDITKNFIRERQFDPKKCQKGTFRTIRIGKKGDEAVICKPKGMKTTRIQSILHKRILRDLKIDPHKYSKGLKW